MKKRKTEQKKMILDVLSAEKRPVSVDDIHNKLEKKIAKSTIYRNLTAMIEEGMIERYYLADNAIHYLLRNNEHQHFITCTKCQDIAPISGCSIHYMEKKTEQDTGFLVSSHYLQMSGKCKKCRETENEDNKQTSLQGV